MLELPALITGLTVVLLIAFAFNVGRARQLYQISAPAITGHPIFERYYRVQTNTIESTVLFLPALWLFSIYIHPGYGALLGVLWLISRICYACAYVNPEKKRRPAFIISLLITAILLISSLGVIIMRLLHLNPSLN